MTNSQPVSDDIKTESRHCAHHGGYEAELFRIADRWVGGNCPKCAEEKTREREEAIERGMQQERELRAMQYRRDSGIPKRFAARTLDTYRADNEGQRRALNIAKKMAGNDSGDGTSLVFCGKPGTGKTHLACGIADEWLGRCRRAKFMTVLAAIRSIKSTYNRASETTEEQAIDALTRIDLLILDEIGVQLGTEHEKMLLFEIINERYQEMKSTILISNLTKAELTDYLGERVMDRFRESGAVVAFDWESYRGSK